MEHDFSIWPGVFCLSFRLVFSLKWLNEENLNAPGLLFLGNKGNTTQLRSQLKPERLLFVAWIENGADVNCLRNNAKFWRANLAKGERTDHGGPKVLHCSCSKELSGCSLVRSRFRIIFEVFVFYYFFCLPFLDVQKSFFLPVKIWSETVALLIHCSVLSWKSRNITYRLFPFCTH